MPDDAIERARLVLADELVRRGDDMAARGVRNGGVELRVEACLAAMLAFASQQVPGMVLVPRDDLARIRTSMCMLQQNSEGCATNHYGGDHELFGMPGWLADTRRDVDALSAMLDAAPSAVEASPRCQKCGGDDVALYSAELAVCPACCDDHEYQHQGVGEWICKTCGYPRPDDWSDGYEDYFAGERA